MQRLQSFMTRRHPSFSQRHLPETSPAPSPLRPASSTSTGAYIAMAGATHVKKSAANTRAEIGHASNELVTATPAAWERRFMGLVLPGNYSPPACDPRVAITSPFEHACLAILHQDARLVLTGGGLDKLYDPPIVCRSVRIPAYVAEDTSEADATEVHYVARYAWWNNIDGTFI